MTLNEIKQQALDKLNDSTTTRDIIVPLYRQMIFAFHAEGGNGSVSEINYGIIERWSKSALRYIKREAWRGIRT